MSVTRSVVVGCGSYLPKNVVTNEDLTKVVDTSDEWIKQRTGIEQRHVAETGEYTSDLGYKAALDALQSAHLFTRYRAKQRRRLGSSVAPLVAPRHCLRPGQAGPGRLD